jgi:hypothetical protein
VIGKLSPFELLRGQEHTMPKLALRASAFTAVLLAATSAHAEMSTEELAKIAQNPIGNLVSVPFQENLYLNTGPQGGVYNLLNIQPVIPTDLNSNWNIITRTIVPVISLPALAPDQSRTYGAGRWPSLPYVSKICLGEFHAAN